MDTAQQYRAAMAAHEAGDLAAAERGYRAVLAAARYMPAMMNLAIVLETAGRPAEAEAWYVRAAALAPDKVDVQSALARHYRDTRQFQRAEPVYRRLLEMQPEDDGLAFEVGVVLLAMQRAEGWRHFDRRPARRAMLERGLSFPEWEGQPLKGKRLFVYREQGFGDQIMMARFLPMLGAGHIAYMGHPALRRLFARFPVDWIDWTPGGAVIEGYDYWTLPCSLPRHLGGAFPSRPYLSGEAARNPPPPGARIGIAWRGEPQNSNDRFRSLPAELAARLKALPGAVSLDPQDTGAADFQATADLIAGLDLVISVDTAVAHLAGAMGKPVWVLLGKAAQDWQWPRQATSPWYPSARLIEQETAGDWAPVVDRVCAEARRI